MMTSSLFDVAQAPPVEVAPPSPESCPVFVVDDERTVRKTVGEILRRKGYPVREFDGAGGALDALSRERIALLISDISMPGVTGVELARRAREKDPDLAVIIFTGVPDSVTAVQSLRLGVADYLTKPVSMKSLEESAERALRRRAEIIYRRELEGWLREEVRRRTEELRQVTILSLGALVQAVEAKDPYLRGGSQRIAVLCARMAEYLGLEARDVEEIRMAGLLHDIGLINTPESVLHKSSGLTEEEYALVKRHVDVGATILRPLTHLGRTVDYVRYHHERLNGSGYPEGLRGDAIPLGAQIVGLAESFAALTSERSFRPACLPGEALATLRASEGIWFHARLLQALERAVVEEIGEAGRQSSAR